MAFRVWRSGGEILHWYCREVHDVLKEVRRHVLLP